MLLCLISRCFLISVSTKSFSRLLLATLISISVFFLSFTEIIWHCSCYDCFCFMAGTVKPKSLMITTSSHPSPEVLSATTVTAPVSSSVQHHHYNDVTSQDGDTLKRKKRKAKKQQDDVLFCNFPNHEGLVSWVSCCSLFIDAFFYGAEFSLLS